MRKIAFVVFLVLGTGLCNPGCDDDTRKEASIPELQGEWNIYLLPPESEIVTYTVEVSVRGPSGTAEVMTYSSQEDDSGPVVVDANTALPIGACGVTITFSDTAGEPLSLVEGDLWTIQVWGELILIPMPSFENSSTVYHVSSGGTYTCSPPRCPLGLYKAGVPVSPEDQVELTGVQVEFPFIKVSQNGASFSAALPEISILSLNLAGHELGDTISLNYHRKIDWDGEGPDFFRVLIYNGSELKDGEDVNASNLGNDEKDKYIALTFEARSAIVRVDFIFGLSGNDDSIWLDEIEERVNVLDAFTDNFSSTTFKDEWQARIPDEMVGSLEISDYGALEGIYSVLAQGGAERGLSGSILTSSTNLGMGMLSGFSGLSQGDISGIGMDSTGLSGINFSIVEEERGGFYSSFTGALTEDDLIYGSFRGESADHSCVEEGQLFVTIDR